MEGGTTRADPLAVLDAAWEREKRPLQTRARWGGYTDPTTFDVVILTLGGLAFAFLGAGYLVFSLTLKKAGPVSTMLYCLGFATVSFAFFRVASDVKKRLKQFRKAKADYLEKRAVLEARLKH